MQQGRSSHPRPLHPRPCRKDPDYVPAEGEGEAGAAPPSSSSPTSAAEGVLNRLLLHRRRLMGGAAESECTDGYMPVFSAELIHQAHLLLFFIAVVQVFYKLIRWVGRSLCGRPRHHLEAEAREPSLCVRFCQPCIPHPRSFMLTLQRFKGWCPWEEAERAEACDDARQLAHVSFLQAVVLLVRLSWVPLGGGGGVRRRPVAGARERECGSVRE